MSILHSPKQNQLLAALPTEEYARLLPYLELVDLPLGQVIYEPNTRISQLYFPTTCIMARMYELESGISRQVSMVGNEGVTGGRLVIGFRKHAGHGDRTKPRYSYRIKASILKKEFEAGGFLAAIIAALQPGTAVSD